MGSVLSYFTGKVSSSNIERDPIEEMAESKTRGAVESMTQNDTKRYRSALQVVQEFLDKSGSMMERQRMLESELETCHERLRRFTENHARVSETGNENISSSNRPSTLEGNYEQFYDLERIDAIECIEGSRIKKEQSKWTEVDDQYIACLIFEESYIAAQELREGFLQGASCILTSAPSIGTQFLERKTDKSADLGDVWFSVKPKSGGQLSSLGQSTVNSLKLIMKETAESCDIDALKQRTLSAFHKRQGKEIFKCYTADLLTKAKMKKYVERCCRYAWKLVCQTPPYMIQGNSFVLKSDVVFDPTYHQVSKLIPPEHNLGLIDIVVWPGLFEGSTGRVIRKTEVLLRSR